jgi:hypothetical protein
MTGGDHVHGRMVGSIFDSGVELPLAYFMAR